MICFKNQMKQNLCKFNLQTHKMWQRRPRHLGPRPVRVFLEAPVLVWPPPWVSWQRHTRDSVA